MNRLNILLALACMFSLGAYAKSPIKFGKVSMEELEMTSYEPDTSAAAVVLYKSASIYTSSTLFRRVKILKKSGVKHSSFVFNGLNNSNIRAKVYNLENGTIIEENVKKESIFYEKIAEDYYAIRIAIPNVKEGTVYDIEVSGQFTLLEFDFQENLPVNQAVLLTPDESFLRIRPVGIPLYKKVGRNTYLAKNVPAFKPEPYINSENNYISRFEFDLLTSHNPYLRALGIEEDEYTTTWDAVNDRLTRSKRFGQVYLSEGNYLSTLANEINENHSDPYEKMKAAYSAIQKIAWNNIESLYISDQGLAKTFNEKSGNSAELNFMLIQLLKKLDIEAAPVAMSTREEGLLSRANPSYLKLNYVITRAVIDDMEYLIDASENRTPIGILPIRCLNQYGRLLTNGGGEWVNLNPTKGENELVKYTLSINDDLSVTGQMENNRQDYSAYKWRLNYNTFANKESYLAEIEKNHPGLRIESATIKNIDDIYAPIIETQTVYIKNMLTQTGSMFTLQPFVLDGFKDNPFKDPIRKYPIDFAYQRNKALIMQLTIPPFLEVSELPQPIHIQLPENTASVIINYKVEDNSIIVAYQLNINTPLFYVNEYEYIRQLYHIIIQKQNQPILLKKTDLAEVN